MGLYRRLRELNQRIAVGGALRRFGSAPRRAEAQRCWDRLDEHDRTALRHAAARGDVVADPELALVVSDLAEQAVAGIRHDLGRVLTTAAVGMVLFAAVLAPLAKSASPVVSGAVGLGGAFLCGGLALLGAVVTGATALRRLEEAGAANAAVAREAGLLA